MTLQGFFQKITLLLILIFISSCGQVQKRCGKSDVFSKGVQLADEAAMLVTRKSECRDSEESSLEEPTLTKHSRNNAFGDYDQYTMTFPGECPVIHEEVPVDLSESVIGWDPNESEAPTEHQSRPLTVADLKLTHQYYDANGILQEESLEASSIPGDSGHTEVVIDHGRVRCELRYRHPRVTFGFDDTPSHLSWYQETPVLDSHLEVAEYSRMLDWTEGARVIHEIPGMTERQTTQGSYSLTEITGRLEVDSIHTHEKEIAIKIRHTLYPALDLINQELTRVTEYRQFHASPQLPEEVAQNTTEQLIRAYEAASDKLSIAVQFDLEQDENQYLRRVLTASRERTLLQEEVASDLTVSGNFRYSWDSEGNRVTAFLVFPLSELTPLLDFSSELPIAITESVMQIQLRGLNYGKLTGPLAQETFELARLTLRPMATPEASAESNTEATENSPEAPSNSVEPSPFVVQHNGTGVASFWENAESPISIDLALSNSLRVTTNLPESSQCQPEDLELRFEQFTGLIFQDGQWQPQFTEVELSNAVTLTQHTGEGSLCDFEMAFVGMPASEAPSEWLVTFSTKADGAVIQDPQESRNFALQARLLVPASQ